MQELTQAIIAQNASELFVPTVALLAGAVICNILRVFSKDNVGVKVLALLLLLFGAVLGGGGLYLTTTKGNQLRAITLSDLPFEIQKTTIPFGGEAWVFQNRWESVSFRASTINAALRKNKAAEAAFKSKINFSEEKK